MLVLLILLKAYPLERMDRETQMDRGLVQLSRWVMHSGREIRWDTLLITLLELIGIYRLEVMVDARQLEPTGLEAREVQSRLSAHLGIADAPLVSAPMKIHWLICFEYIASSLNNGLRSALCRWYRFQTGEGAGIR